MGDGEGTLAPRARKSPRAGAGPGPRGSSVRRAPSQQVMLMP